MERERSFRDGGKKLDLFEEKYLLIFLVYQKMLLWKQDEFLDFFNNIES